jgi:hypothetical protein
MEANMPGDPKECRQHALNCMLLAKHTANQESKQTFLSLSQSWTRLAVELENAQALLDAVNAMDTIRLPERLASDESDTRVQINDRHMKGAG